MEYARGEGKKCRKREKIVDKEASPTPLWRGRGTKRHFQSAKIGGYKKGNAERGYNPTPTLTKGGRKKGGGEG